MRSLHNILFIISISSGIVVCQKGAATSAADWLNIESGTRGISMGGAQVAAGRGLSGAYFNPASITFIDGSEVYFSKSAYLAGITHNTLGYGTRLTPSDYFGVHLFYLDSGEMAVTTETSPDGTGEYFNVLDISLRLIYGKQLTDRLRIGGAIKYIRERIFTTHMQSFIFDLGSNFNTGVYGIILGMSVSNLGLDVQFKGEGLNVPVEEATNGALSKITEKFPVPLVFRLGMQKDIFGGDDEGDSRLTVSADAINPVDDIVFESGWGAEYSWRDMAFIRGGTHLSHDTAGLSLGAAIKWKIISIDYAYLNYGILEETHQFGISLEF